MNYIYEETERINMIKEYLNNNPKPIAKGKILDIENDVPESYDVYEMPMYFFVHNWNNGRHFLETQQKIETLNLRKTELDPVKDNNLIEEMLYKSKEEKNNFTKENLKKFSQQEPVIATRNGIIIDGNRRFMLLKRIWNEENVDLEQRKIKVIILNNDYLTNQLNSLETKIQFRKESKVDYDPINKKIKIFNIYEEMLTFKGEKNKIEKFKNDVNNDILKEISINTGESQTKIKEYLKIISFVKWFLESKNANFSFNLFLNTDEQLKNLYKVVKNIEEGRKKTIGSKMWFEEDESIEKMFIDASMNQILHKVKAVGSFRDIMGSKGWGVLRYKELFFEWYEETMNIIGNNCLELNFIPNFETLEVKRNKLEVLNTDILFKINEKRKKELSRIEETSGIINKSFAEMQIQNAISFFSRRLNYFDSLEKVSEEDRNQLEKINRIIEKFLLKNRGN